MSGEIELIIITSNMLATYCEQMILFMHWLNNYNEDEILPVTLSIINNIPHVKIEEYFVHWIPRYLDSEFFALFRMTKQTFQVLLTALECSEREYTGGEQPISMEKALLMTLWWLGKGEVLLSVADRFNVAVSTVYNLSDFMLGKLINIINKYITWPDKVEVYTVERDFHNRSGYPGVIGAIDVCNIKFKPPAEQQNSYIDKNRNHSIKLQGIVTCNKIFTNIMVGYPGSAHDSRVFKNSKLYLDIEENGLKRHYFYEDRFHLIGDKAYPLKVWIMTPYKDNGNLSPRQRHHNSCHSITRTVVEHTFGLLKSRWRILQAINVNSVEKTIRIITACCVLHNFCYVNHDFWNTYEHVENDNDAFENIGDMQAIAMHKRNTITDLLWEQ